MQLHHVLSTSVDVSARQRSSSSFTPNIASQVHGCNILISSVCRELSPCSTGTKWHATRHSYWMLHLTVHKQTYPSQWTIQHSLTFILHHTKQHLYLKFINKHIIALLVYLHCYKLLIPLLFHFSSINLVNYKNVLTNYQHGFDPCISEGTY